MNLPKSDVGVDVSSAVAQLLSATTGNQLILEIPFRSRQFCSLHERARGMEWKTSPTTSLLPHGLVIYCTEREMTCEEGRYVRTKALEMLAGR